MEIFGISILCNLLQGVVIYILLRNIAEKEAKLKILQDAFLRAFPPRKKAPPPPDPRKRIEWKIKR